MMWSNNGMGWGGWIIMTAGMLGFWALVVVAVLALIRGGQVTPSGPLGGSGYDDPRRVLDERFARGEIDLEDYQARRELLSQP